MIKLGQIITLKPLQEVEQNEPQDTAVQSPEEQEKGDSAEVKKLSKPFKEPDAEGTEKEWDAEPGKRIKNFPRVYAEKKGLKKKKEKRDQRTQDLYAASLPD